MILFKNLIKSLAITSLVFNVLALILVYFYPAQIEKTAKEFINRDIERAILKFHETEYHKKIPRFLKEQIPIDLENKENQLKNALNKDLLFKIKDIVNSTCLYACPSYNDIEAKYQNMNSVEVEQALKSEKGLNNFIKYKYYKVLNRLLNSLKIFFGINALIFLIVFGGVHLSPHYKIFFPIGITLSISTFLAMFLYIFNTNWLYTTVFNDFMGFSYIFMVLGIFLLLSDLFFNKGKVIRFVGKFFKHIPS